MRKKLAIILTVLMVTVVMFGILNCFAVTTPLEASRVNIKPVDNTGNTEYKIAVLGFENNPYWVSIKDGVTWAQQNLREKNCKVDWVVASETLDTAKLIAAVESCMAQQYDGIAIPVFDAGVVPILKQAMDQGITVTTYITEVDQIKQTKRLALFGQNVPAGGTLAGKTIVKLLNGKGKVGIITGGFGVASHEARRKAALAEIKKAKGIKVIGEYENADKAEKAYSLTKDMLTAHPDLKAVYVTAGGPFGAARAIEEAGLKGKCFVVCFDAVPDNIKYVRKGIIAATIADSPFIQAYDSVVANYNYVAAKKTTPSREMWTKLEVITPQNVDSIIGPETK